MRVCVFSHCAHARTGHPENMFPFCRLLRMFFTHLTKVFKNREYIAMRLLPKCGFVRCYFYSINAFRPVYFVDIGHSGLFYDL